MTTEAEALRPPRKYAEELLFAFANSGESAAQALVRKFTACQRDALKAAAAMLHEEAKAFVDLAALAEKDGDHASVLRHKADRSAFMECAALVNALVAKPTPPPEVEPFAKIDAALNRIMDGETTTATATECHGHVTVKVGTANPAHATAPPQVDPCGRCLGKRVWGDEMCPDCSPPAELSDPAHATSHDVAAKSHERVQVAAEHTCKCGRYLRRVVFWEDGVRKQDRESCPACSPPAAAKDEPDEQKRLEAALVAYWARVGAIPESEEPMRALKSQLRREAIEECAQLVEFQRYQSDFAFAHDGAEKKMADKLRKLADAPAAPSLDEHEAVKAWRALPQVQQNLHLALLAESLRVDGRYSSDSRAGAEAALAVLRAVAGGGR